MNWLKQQPGKPLFPEILWSQPENKRLAGKLLVIGGNSHSFKAPADAVASSEKAGAGQVRVVLPDSLRKTLLPIFPEAIFTSSTPSGSFARDSLAEFISSGEWADTVLLAGDFGKNSETAILLESFLQKYEGLVVLAGDSLDYFQKSGESLLNRTATLLAAELPRLQKLILPEVLIKQSMDLHQITETLGELTRRLPVHILTFHANQAIAASAGRVSTTPRGSDLNELAARAAVFWLQNRAKPFEAITTSLVIN